MAGRVPEDILQSIRDRVSIVELVSAHVSLKRNGKNHLGLCPFHSEKSPSFTVNEDRGLFHCFGCGAGGNVFSFVMRSENLPFPDAVEFLARRVGIEIPRSPREVEVEQGRNRLFEINALAQEYFFQSLRGDEGVAARRYLEGRGFGAEILDRYRVGFCPVGSGLFQRLRRSAEDVRRAVDLGLIGVRGDRSGYDRFRGRVMFPIRDTSGRVVGFGGRTMGTDAPKYLNSPESALFHKGSVLYGLFEARDSIRAAGRMVIVEGYLDALAMAAHGFEYVVASLGTALGVNQLRAAKRFSPVVIAFFDGDRAGRGAANRAFGVCAQADVWGLAAFLPEGFDPDTFVQQRGVEATKKLLDSATPLSEFFLESEVPGPGASVPERVAAAKSIGEVLRLIKDPTQFGLLARMAAQRLSVDESLFRELHQQQRPGSSREQSSDNSIIQREELGENLRPEEVALVEAAILDKNAAKVIGDSGVVEAMSSHSLAEALDRAMAAWTNGGDASAVLHLLPTSIASRVSAGLVGRGVVPTGGFEAVARDCISRIYARHRRTKSYSLRADLSRSEDSGQQGKYLEELQELNDLIKRRSSSN